MFGLSALLLKVDDNGSKWISFESFYSYLKTNLSAKDSVKELRLFNVRREVVKYGVQHFKPFDGIDFISTIGVLKYVFNHCDDYEHCYLIINQIQKNVFTSNKLEINNKNQLQLYKTIIQYNVFRQKQLFNFQPILDFKLKYIEIIYKTFFTESEWNVICFFEHHFEFSISNQHDNVESIVEQKWKFLESIQSSKVISKYLISSAQETIKHRVRRMNDQCQKEEARLGTKVSHRISLIEKSILLDVQEMVPIGIKSVACVQCKCLSTTENIDIVDVIIGVDAELSEIEIDDIKSLILHICNNDHTLYCHQCLMLDNETTKSYIQDGQVARFKLYDDILLGNLKNSILFSCNIFRYNIVPDSSDSNEPCISCHTTFSSQVLSVHNFDAIQEWCMDVPLIVQIFMESFINCSTVQQSNTKESTLMKKIERLYFIFDMLLNTYNKKFSGIYQQMVTDELLMNYRSINTLFKVTNRYGFTTSLNVAERNLAMKSFSDTMYYQTYLKPYCMTYTTLAGEVTRKINLQNCHIILMLDNLVRLKYHSDPNPGEHRCKQLCMLPITLQGMPKDSVECHSWHDDEMCNGTDDCNCKKKLSLSRDEAFTIMTDFTNDEEIIFQKFLSVCRWGNEDLWKSLNTSTWLQNFVDEAVHYEVSNTELTSTTNNNSHEVESSDIELAGILDVGSNEDIDIDAAVTDSSNLAEMVNEAEEGLDGITEFEDLAVILDDSQSSLELSMDSLCLEQTCSSVQSALSLFGLHKYSPPKLLTRHPPPASGRDDDKLKLKEILDDILVKTGLDTVQNCSEKILFGPDNKIGINLLSLQRENKKYESYLAEFPLLHLRKSKVNTLFSAYRNSGLLELLMVMRDDTTQEWSKLLTAHHIDTATKHVRRLGQAIQFAFTISFIQYLPPSDAILFMNSLQTCNAVNVAAKWGKEMKSFIEKGKELNATFALHFDMMTHCHEVVAIYISERLGGKTGYALLLATVKSSLWFSFLNGASSYAPYCTRLLVEYYRSGTFYKNMKETLYSTPIGKSNVNFACDTKREMDHKDALKGFRSGSSQESATRRMSLIDTFNETHHLIHSKNKSYITESEDINWQFTNTDIKHIFRVTEVILQQKALSMVQCQKPFNVYTPKRAELSIEILDKETSEIGKYLLKKFLCKDNLFDLKPNDIPDLQNIKGPPNLKNRVKRSIGVTVKRIIKQSHIINLTEREKKESQRSKVMSGIIKQTDRLSSEMNMCQAIVKPDCSKPKVLKSSTMKSALENIIEMFAPGECSKFINCAQKNIPNSIVQSVKIATIEFAGVKFKTKAISGSQYILYVQNAILCPLLLKLKNTTKVILCEEKYSFTPDNFKESTRLQRKTKHSYSIDHLKTPSQILGQEIFEKSAITGTNTGKSLISNFLAANAGRLRLPREITLVIDSEFKTSCQCGTDEYCACDNKFSTPMICQFSTGKPQISFNYNVHQKKGEAEMAQVDWLIDCRNELNANESIASIVTSGDIDAVCIHLFAVSKLWPRFEDGTFKNSVFVILQKPHLTYDVYNITDILQLLEQKMNDKRIGMKLALGLCIGGNDFIPKLKGMSHDKILKLYFQNPYFLQNLIKFDDKIIIESHVYEQFVKHLYCPKGTDPDTISCDEVRKKSREKKRHLKKDHLSVFGNFSFLTNADSWMPPKSALSSLSNIINLQIQYLQTVGIHDANLPDFLASSCLKLSATGQTEYDFGPEAFSPINNILTTNESGKRTQDETPQKGQRRKRQLTSTPKKDR